MGFENILGNEKIKKYLNTSIEDKNVLHSYLFLGTSGIGKLLIAKEFAKHILCLNEKVSDCNCKSCLCFDSNNHPDFLVLNEEGETIKVEQIRELIEKVYEKPIVSEKKVYIINDAENMTKEAQNCLLKTLEEPPEYVTIILVSSNDNLILNTIKSRCSSIKFENIEENVLKKYIEENLEYNNLTENLLKYFDGSIGKAIKTQDKVDKLLEIEKIVHNIKNEKFLDFIKNTKIIYDKDNVLDYLDYLIVCLYKESEQDKLFLNCIPFVVDCINKHKLNAYLDMNIDILLFKIWEEVNESSNRS